MHLLFAGAESKKIRELLKESGIKKVLVSYHYVKRRNVPIEWYFENFDWVALDRFAARPELCSCQTAFGCQTDLGLGFWVKNR